MKKFAVLYTNPRTGTQYWAGSSDGNGGSYSLIEKTSEIPPTQAMDWYGKNAEKYARQRIAYDTDPQHFSWYGYEGSVVEYEAEPTWYFDIWYVLRHQYGDREMDQIRKGFKLSGEKQYKLWPGSTRPRIHDLDLEDLKAYYEWRKEHFKGKLKSI